MGDDRSQLFHRAFYQPPKRMGLSESDSNGDKEVRHTRRELWNEINRLFQDAGSRFRVNDRPPRLYFDFIRADTFNASAKFYEGIYHIGLHDVAVRRILDLAAALASKPSLYRSIGITDVFDADTAASLNWVPSSQLITVQRQSLALYISLFAVGHELGHHIYGHTAADFTNKSPIFRQAAEIEADCYSVLLTLKSKLLQGNEPILDRSVARLIFLAAAVYLDCVTDPAVDWKRSKEQEYPPYSIRLEHVHGAIQTEWQRLRPQAEAALSLPALDELLHVAHGVWARKQDSLTLLRQMDDLEESVLTDYNTELAIARRSLREELREHQWHDSRPELESVRPTTG